MTSVANSNSGHTSSMSLVDKNNSSIGIGNYKGVMLCNRPFAGVEANSKTTSAADKTSFACGIVADKVGTNVSINNLYEKTHIKRPKKETALTKHRKWLADLQSTKDRLEQQYVEENQRKLDELQKFTEREQKMRQLARDSNQDTFKQTAAHQSSSSVPSLAAESKQSSNDHASSAAGSKKTGVGGVKMPRPAWALSKDAANAASDEKAEDEDDDLIDFAKGLDFERYIDDLEVHTMMEKVKKRISELEAEVQQDAKREAEYDNRRQQAKGTSYGAGSDDDEGGDENDAANQNDEYAAAKTLLDETENLRGVHSTKSMAAIVKSTVNKNNTGAKDEGGSKMAQNEPIIVTHQSGDGSRLEQKHAINNIPYMHRNPAV